MADKTAWPRVPVVTGGGDTKQFVGTEPDITPRIAALTAGVEYVWIETDGSGVKINEWAGVAA